MRIEVRSKDPKVVVLQKIRADGCTRAVSEVEINVKLIGVRSEDLRMLLQQRYQQATAMQEPQYLKNCKQAWCKDTTPSSLLTLILLGEFLQTLLLILIIIVLLLTLLELLPSIRNISFHLSAIEPPAFERSHASLGSHGVAETHRHYTILFLVIENDVGDVAYIAIRVSVSQADKV